MKVFGQIRVCPVHLSAGVGAVAGSFYVIYRLAQLRRRNKLYSTRRLEAERAKNAALADVEDADEDLTEKSLEDLLSALRDGRISALEITRAFLAKALRVTQKTNCVVEPLPNLQADAQNLDTARSSGGTLGLLHGMPVSVKENYAVKGTASTIGFGKWCKPMSEDAVLVKVLRAQGALPFVKTNVPQTMISFECSNPIYGVTRNPHNLSRGPGGSSGGECALIASGGSHLGIGTDIGGSARIPAAFCGICGFKPTENRLSGEGAVSALVGQSGIAKSTGLLSRNVEGCRLLMQALCCEEMWRLDRRVVPMPFNHELATGKRRLRIGYYDDDRFFQPTPAYQRAVHEAKAALEAAGHELVPFHPPNILDAVGLYYKLVSADELDTVRELLHNETVDDAIAYGYRLANLPLLIRLLVSSFLRLVWPRMYLMMGNIRQRSVMELWKLQKNRQDYRALFCSAWESQQLDGVISPSHAMGPPPIGICARLTATCSYTFLYNLLDFPAGVVPVTAVTDADEAALDLYPVGDLWARQVVKYARGLVGMPVNVQCVTLPWQEEQCLYLMQEVESSMKVYRDSARQ